ncbi:MAG TPA: ammonia channel protein, partial [Anaerolineae bacterium]|nr:ammonia channel protein [Anaerolineae bacterium]
MPNLDTGNTAFMLLCTSLVMLMTPGLAFFYGGLVGRRNVLAIMMQSFVSMGWTTVIWFAVGYSLCFSGDVGGIIGNLDQAFLRGITLSTPAAANDTIPLLVFVAYQMMFAIITPALISGAVAERMKFTSYLLFTVLWSTFVYFPLCHMVWGKGGLFNWALGGRFPALDFAGGTVVHISSGVSALVCAVMLGHRDGFPHEPMMPHNVVLSLIGTGRVEAI